MHIRIGIARLRGGSVLKQYSCALLGSVGVAGQSGGRGRMSRVIIEALRGSALWAQAALKGCGTAAPLPKIIDVELGRGAPSLDENFVGAKPRAPSPFLGLLLMRLGDAGVAAASDAGVAVPAAWVRAETARGKTSGTSA